MGLTGVGFQAETIPVTVASDELNGNLSPNDISLREAIRLADRSLQTRDTIVFDESLGGQTITLNHGRLSVTGTADIVGLGADQTTIDAGGQSRVFDMTSSRAVGISGLTLINGAAPGFDGGAIRSAGHLSLIDVAIRDSRADRGGAVFNGNVGGNVRILNSEFSGNSSELDGGAVHSHARTRISNSTFSDNQTAGRGGALYQLSESAEIYSSTFINNWADTDSNGGLLRIRGMGGGVAAEAGNEIFLMNTIVAGNHNGSEALLFDDDIAGRIDGVSANNLIGVSRGSGSDLVGINNNLVGSIANPLDPLAGPLTDNGGATRTHELLPGSPAINAGNNNEARDLFGQPLLTDQRAGQFDRLVGGTVDIGAFEKQELRLRIADAIANESDGTIDFVITLSQPLPAGDSITVQVTTFDDSAVSGADYTPQAAQNFTINGGPSLTRTLSIPIVDDSVVELDESFDVQLSAFPASILSRGEATGTIVSDDSATFTIDDVTVNENQGTAELTVRTNNPVDIPVTVDVNYTEGSATSDDFDSSADAVSFAAGDGAAKTVTVAITDDLIVEGRHDFTAAISSSTDFGGRDVTVSDAALASINDDDVATFLIDDVVVDEGGTATFTVSLDQPVDVAVDIDVSYLDGPATSADFDGTQDVVSFAAGDTSSKTATVAVTEDNLVEGTHAFTAMLSTVTAIGDRQVGLSDTGNGTIVDNDTAGFRIDDVTVNEADGTAAFTVSLDNPVDIPILVDLNLNDGTAGSGDYDRSAQTLNFAAGNADSQSVTVGIFDDELVEGTEFFSAIMSTTTEFGDRVVDLSDTATATINDNDAAASFTIDDVTVNESDGIATFTVSLDNPINIPVEVSVTYSDRSATDADYDNTTDVISFAVGELSKTVGVDISDDAIVEGTHQFEVGLSTSTDLGARTVDLSDTAVGTIIDDDEAVFRIEDVTTSEGLGTATFSVSLDNPIDIPIVVALEFQNSTASDADYDRLSQTVNFDAGDVDGRTVTVGIVDDELIEGTESFSVSLSSAADLGDRAVDFSDTAIGTIIDNDVEASFTINDVTVDESDDAATFTVSLDNAINIPVDVNVTYADLPATGDDYDSATDVVRFAAGELSKEVTVGIVDDSIVEGTHQFAVSLSTSTDLGAREVDLSDTAVGTIIDDDVAVFTIDDVETSEGLGSATFVISLNKPIDIPVEIDVTYQDGSATAADYDNTTDTVTFAAGDVAGKTVTVDIVDDDVVETSHSFTAALVTSTDLGSRNVDLSDTAIATIADNDTAIREWHNELLAQDTNRDGEVTARDALLVINDIARNGARDLNPVADADTPDVDVNQSGSVSALDALQVINYLARVNGQAEGVQGPQSGLGFVSSSADDDRPNSLSAENVDTAFSLF